MEEEQPNQKTDSSEFDHHQTHHDGQDVDEELMSAENNQATNEELDQSRIVKHIMVIGFHHKHGYQVDYCYPPLEANGPVFSTPARPICLPASWKTLPLLCLPDGSHNYDSDTIYFTMPDYVAPTSDEQAEKSSLAAEASEGIKTIFGTACYRQIQADKLLNRTDDMTRVAVQKSVCVLSTKPLFGLIRSKLEMITHAYFEELDFSKVRILKLTYDNLNSLLSRDSVKENATFLGLSARHLVSNFGCNMLVLFKAMLLEKKILFYKSPVKDLCSTILSMCSLFTGLLECNGLDRSTCDLQLSPTLLEALKLLTPAAATTDTQLDNCEEAKESPHAKEGNKVFFSPAKEEVVILKSSDTNFSDSFGPNNENVEGSNDNRTSNQDESIESQTTTTTNKDTEQTSDFELIPEDAVNSQQELDTGEDVNLNEGFVVDDPYAFKLCRLKPEKCGLPLQIFTRGSFCLPYLSISYLDLLSDTRVKSFVIGATNVLFKQRKELYDIIVDMEENTIVINNPNLKKILSLSTEDLRFMDFLSRQVKLDPDQLRVDEFNLISQDITKWVGGDEWIRYHFRLYTLYLLKAAKTGGASAESFNSSFVETWKQTSNNYKIWLEQSQGSSSLLDGLQSRHPFSSTVKRLNLNDMKLKLSYAVNSSDKGKLINQTLNGIGKWSIWNNIASVAEAASTAVVSAASSTSNQLQQTAPTLAKQFTGSEVSRQESDSNNK